ncbi:DUF4406 domain-containing protein [Pseudolactococcus reticulitermitis]|uniref:Nucleoside 2-deoxyribosyltransferase n=1 Tax=Pseudolactococcus reticulitermitis TaxID=2025039 RepID=A0A224WYV1_9LACT|nr:DUF4406 domain-containing protein [Lactococcus reticulitermitis]GAX47289.1 hypothetical protein RsY01_888 [Lactococcus reticulitermitis]
MKVYLATPMNGKSIEEIKEKIADFASLLANKGIDFFNPFLETVAKDNAADGIVKDKRPIEMLCNSARYIEDCDGVIVIGSREEFKQSKGCQIEAMIAALYDKDCYLYDGNEFKRFKSIELKFGVEK